MAIMSTSSDALILCRPRGNRQKLRDFDGDALQFMRHS